MGDPDQLRQLTGRVVGALRPSGVRAPATQAAAYLAPTSDGDHVYQAHYSDPAAPAGGAGRRYVGRSTGGGAREVRSAPSPATARPASAPKEQKPRPLHPQPSTRARAVVVPWSFRLVVAVAAVTGVLLAARMVGLLTLPVDAGLGVESTFAAQGNVLAGRLGAPLEPIRFLPPTPPWYGSAPANPVSGLPIYVWLTGGLMGLLGAGSWLGRAISILLATGAGLLLFATVRRAAGARSAVYAMLLYAVAPLSVVLGQQFSPASLLLATQALVMLMVVRWRGTVSDALPRGSSMAFGLAVAAGVLAALIDPGTVFLALPVAYLVLSPQPFSGAQSTSLLTKGREAAMGSWREAWDRSPNRGRLLALVWAMAGVVVLWWVFASGAQSGLWLSAGDGGGGVPAAVAALLSGSTYVQIVGLMVEQVLTVLGLVLLGAGLLHAARPPMQMVFHLWLLGGAAHVLADASRLARHDDVLLPLILPACALAGIGAAWAGSLPARVWVAVNEQRRDQESDYAISPHTAWLLDLPEERIHNEKSSRPQAQLALSRSVAQRSQTELLKIRRAWLLAVGHIAVLVALGLITAGGARAVYARLQPSQEAMELRQIGEQIAAVTPNEARIIIAGPNAPELFYASGRTGWALSHDDFTLAEVQALQRAGAGYLLSADQDWLGKHPDYRGLITTYSVLKLDRAYILFDLNTRPAASDRLYFLESGHTLGGVFRAFWERNGGVLKLGYPLSEELEEASPLDGQVRTVQYFERAVLERHKEFAGTPDEVMPAAVGRWVTLGKNFQRVEPFTGTEARWYFADTGHSVKQAFLRYWQKEGGVAVFGYPISEELPEINPADGKVYTVQYFERARFEWHPTFAGTPNEVQLGLIGKQALEMPRR